MRADDDSSWQENKNLTVAENKGSARNKRSGRRQKKLGNRRMRENDITISMRTGTAVSKVEQEFTYTFAGTNDKQCSLT